MNNDPLVVIKNFHANPNIPDWELEGDIMPYSVAVATAHNYMEKHFTAWFNQFPIREKLANGHCSHSYVLPSQRTGETCIIQIRPHRELKTEEK